MKTLIVVPARYGSTRFPGKPLVEIAGRTMVSRVAAMASRAAAELDDAASVVATDDERIASHCRDLGIEVVMTDPNVPSGTDRALAAVDAMGVTPNVVVNLQGDLPTVEPATVAAAVQALKAGEADIATVAVEIEDEAEKINPNVVKVVGTPIGENRLRALYFTRATAPWGDGPLYHHVGLYAYRRAALERFVALPPSPLERREKLEQLRALEAGMRIDVAVVKAAPLGVDTAADLERARAIFSRG